jgi:hypothetical protein
LIFAAGGTARDVEMPSKKMEDNLCGDLGGRHAALTIGVPPTGG